MFVNGTVWTYMYKFIARKPCETFAMMDLCGSRSCHSHIRSLTRFYNDNDKRRLFESKPGWNEARITKAVKRESQKVVKSLVQKTRAGQNCGICARGRQIKITFSRRILTIQANLENVPTPQIVFTSIFHPLICLCEHHTPQLLHGLLGSEWLRWAWRFNDDKNNSLITKTLFFHEEVRLVLRISS